MTCGHVRVLCLTEIKYDMLICFFMLLEIWNTYLIECLNYDKCASYLLRELCIPDVWE